VRGFVQHVNRKRECEREPGKSKKAMRGDAHWLKFYDLANTCFKWPQIAAAVTPAAAIIGG